MRLVVASAAMTIAARYPRLTAAKQGFLSGADLDDAVDWPVAGAADQQPARPGPDQQRLGQRRAPDVATVDGDRRAPQIAGHLDLSELASQRDQLPLCKILIVA